MVFREHFARGRSSPRRPRSPRPAGVSGRGREHRIVLDGPVVRLEGFRSQHADTVTVIGGWGRHRLALLVVPPETEPVLAQQILMPAAHADNIDDIGTLLTRHTATQRRELDGGRTPISV
jgi:hypothetical protein